MTNFMPRVNWRPGRTLRKLFALLAFSGSLVAPCWGQTAADIITRARVLLNDTSSDSTRQRFSDAQLLGFLNDGQREAVAFSWVLKSSYTLTLVSGTTEYALPSDFVATWRVLYRDKKLDQTSLPELDANTVGWRNVAGIPQKYYIYLGATTNIGFYPAPSTGSAGTVVVYYYQQPADLTTTSETPWNGWALLTPYQSGLVYYIAYRGYSALHQADLATPYFSEWALFVNGLKEAASKTPDFNPGIGGLRK